jgi:hypothetical protein
LRFLPRCGRLALPRAARQHRNRGGRSKFL